VSSYPESGIARGMDLINSADKILTKVKAAGGNRVFSTYEVSGKKTVITEGVEPTDVRFLKEKIDKLNKSGKQSLVEFIFAFAKTIELKDHYTGEHVENTVHYSTELAKRLHLPQDEIENIREASVLHDLGKIGISDQILHKKSKLTKKEFDVIKKHPQIAADIIRPIQFMHDIIPLILYHHERWDGKGYPAGLKGEEIPVGARIISVSDVYQALTSNRPYRKAFSKKAAVDIIKKGAGTQFDPNIVDIFIPMVLKEKK
jgi:HD-GYP domain-containing protein (c-di-GMP phosphodiesterase class II)